MATLLFNLARIIESRNVLIDVLVIVSCMFVAMTGALCGLTLAPRITDTESGARDTNPLFYVSISEQYMGRRADYRRLIKHLTSNQQLLVGHLSDQVHANALIATKKAKVVQWAIRSCLATGAVIGLAAIFIGLSVDGG